MLKTLLEMFKKEHELNLRLIWSNSGIHSARILVRFNEDEEVLSVVAADPTTEVLRLDGVHYSISANCEASGLGNIVVPVDWPTVTKMYLGNLKTSRCYSVSIAPVNSALFVLD